VRLGAGQVLSAGLARGAGLRAQEHETRYEARIAAHTVPQKLKARRISRPPKPSNASANVAVGFGAGARVRWALKGETGHPALKEPIGRSVLKGPTGHPALTGLTGRSAETLPPLTDPTPLMTGLRLVTPC
jgi:hypothetical protein